VEHACPAGYVLPALIIDLKSLYCIHFGGHGRIFRL